MTEHAEHCGEWHGVRIVFRVATTGGELRREVEESTDAVAWFERSHIERLPKVEPNDLALLYLDAA